MNIQSRSNRYRSSRQIILATSREIFLQHGYSDGSMDTIAQRSGVSKTTLYAHFESKEALFNQVVVEMVEEHGPDTAKMLDVPPEANFHEALVTIGRRMLDTLLDPQVMALTRLCVVEGRRMSRRSCEGLAAARTRLLVLLTGFFRERAGSGRSGDELRRAADLFIVLTLRDFQLQAMLPWSVAATPEAYRDHVEQVADLMLRLYDAPAGSAQPDRIMSPG